MKFKSLGSGIWDLGSGVGSRDSEVRESIIQNLFRLQTPDSKTPRLFLCLLSTVYCLLFLPFNIYAEEGTTTIPQSELTITGEDKYSFEWKEDLPEVELSFPEMEAPKPAQIEKEEEKIKLNIAEEKEKFTIKEKPSQFLKEEVLPLIKISLGNYNFFSSSILFAKEKKEKGGSLLIERERLGGFEYNGKKDFHSQNRDNICLSGGFAFNEARITPSCSFLNQEVFLPYENRDEKRKSLHFELGYETLFYNNLRFSGNIFDEKKDFIKNRGMGSRLSFDFAKKNRLNIEAENEGDFAKRNLLKIFFSFYPTKKQFKKRPTLIQSELGFSVFRNKSTIFQPELDVLLKSLWKKDLTLFLSLKTFMNSQSFSSLYFKTPYSTVSTNLKPERIFRIEGGGTWKKEGLSIKNSLFLEGKNDYFKWQKKLVGTQSIEGLYEPKNSGSLFSYGIRANVNYSLTPKINTEFSAFVMDLSKDINYAPRFKGEVILKYKDGPLFISPSISCKGLQKTDSGSIGGWFVLNIKGERKISDEFEIFFNIENLFNNNYMEMEDYPGKRLVTFIGLKIRL